MHQLFKRRRSVRKFTDQQPTDDQIKQILLSAMTAPSGNGLHPVEYIIVKNKETIKKLSQCGDYQNFIINSSLVIVVISNPIVSQKNWLVDASIAAAHIYLEAVNQGLATCWANVYMGKLGNGSDREEYVRSVLEIPADKNPVCILPIGYSDQKLPDHGETDFDLKKVHQEKW